MNHFILPEPASSCDDGSNRYGSISCRHMIEQLLETDPKPAHYQAHILGGAAVLASGNWDCHIGQRNLEIAHRILKQFNIRIVDEKSGGNRGLKIAFQTDTGQIRWRFSGDVPRKNRRNSL